MQPGAECPVLSHPQDLARPLAAAQIEPYLRAEWRMAITESDGSLGQFGAWACHRRRQSRHGRGRTGANWQARAAPGGGPAVPPGAASPLQWKQPVTSARLPRLAPAF